MGSKKKLQSLQKELLKKANNKEAYDEIADKIFKLREQREKCTVDTAARDAQIGRNQRAAGFHQAAARTPGSLRRGPGKALA